MVTEPQMLAKALKQLMTRGLRVEKRERYYNGRHPSQLGSESWNRTFRRQVAGVIDNQCALVVDVRADALIPSGVIARTEDKVDIALALWASERFEDEGDTLSRVTRVAEWSGEQTVVAVDYNGEGEVDCYPLDPRAAYVERARGGEYLWGVHFWKADDDGDTQATLYLPTETVHYAASSPSPLPSWDDFREVARTTNPHGEVMLAAFQASSPVIDTIAPMNDLLNKSLQTQLVVGEAHANPLRVWLGIETYDPDTGEVAGPQVTFNPATSSRDVVLPTVQDAEGDQREVLQLDSPSTTHYPAEQDSFRASIARLGSVPASMLQVGGRPESGEALEIAYLPFVAWRTAAWRTYGPSFDRLARLAVKAHLYASTGRPMDAPRFRTQPSMDGGSTEKSRMELVANAVAAGMTLEDALVELFGMTREAAQLVMGNAAAQRAERDDRAAARLEQGYLDEVE